MDVVTNSAKEDIQDLKLFWNKVPFFGSRIEAFAARHWYELLLAHCALVLVIGFYSDKTALTPHTLRSVTVILRDPFVWTLLLALFVSAIAFDIWQSTMRRIFSTAIESGIVAGSKSIRSLLALSRRFETQMRSRLRLIAMIPPIIPVLYTCIRIAEGNNLSLTSFLIYFAVPESFLLLFACGIGAVAWTLLCTARWIATLSRAGVLRIQPGHSDGCCGLAGIGTCCLQSAVPLLVGMVLCLVWTNSYHLPAFKDFRPIWLSFIVPISYVIMVFLFALACALVFLPVRGIHRRLEAYKAMQDEEFTRVLEQELASIREALAASDDNRIKASSERLKLAQALDPTVLKLATWPFDRTSLIKYGFTPLASLAASFGKEVIRSLFQ